MEIELIGEPFEPSKPKGKNYSRNNASGERKASDLYETPYSMTRQLLEVEKFDYRKRVFEMASGNGAQVKVLREKFEQVIENDISYGLDSLVWPAKMPYVITNPPYSLAFEFIQHAKRITTKKFAFLLPLTYLQGQARFDKIYQDRRFPLARVHVFIRYPMLGDPLREDGKYRTGMQTYAWFVWDKNHRGPPNIGWIDNREYVLNARDT
jgi:hypothetical protein